jgi:hypothetical protein
MQERQAREQIVHERLSAVWLVWITPGTGSKTGQVDGIPEVEALVGFPAFNESQRGFAGFGVDV